jgi:hypothetical protein
MVRDSLAERKSGVASRTPAPRTCRNRMVCPRRLNPTGRIGSRSGPARLPDPVIPPTRQIRARHPLRRLLPTMGHGSAEEPGRPPRQGCPRDRRIREEIPDVDTRLARRLLDRRRRRTRGRRHHHAGHRRHHSGPARARLDHHARRRHEDVRPGLGGVPQGRLEQPHGHRRPVARLSAHGRLRGLDHRLLGRRALAARSQAARRDDDRPVQPEDRRRPGLPAPADGLLGLHGQPAALHLRRRAGR